MNGDDLFVSSEGISLPVSGLVARLKPALAGLDVGSVTEVDTKTGAVLSRMSGSAYEFSAPCALASDGTDIFVGSLAGNVITDVNPTTGAFVQLIPIPPSDSFEASSMLVSGSYLFLVENVAVINTSTNGITQLISGSAYHQ